MYSFIMWRGDISIGYKDTNTINLDMNQKVTYTRGEEYAKGSFKSLTEVFFLKGKKYLGR